MALITEIRNRFGLVVLLLGLALAAFVIMDMQSASQRSGGSSFTAGSVNGEKIDWNEFQRAENILYSGGGGDVFSRRNYLWDFFVENKLVSDEAEAIGLQVTDEQISELKRGANPSPVIQSYFSNAQTGQFDRNLFNQFIQAYDAGQLQPNSVSQWEYLDGQVRKDRLQRYITNMATKGLYTPNWMAENVAKQQQSRADVAYVAIPYDQLPTVEVSDADITSYINDHKEEYYSDEEQRSISYLSFRIEPTAQDSADILERLRLLRGDLEAADNDSLFFINNEGIYPPQYVRMDRLTEDQKERYSAAQPGDIYGPYLEADAGSYRLVKIIDRKAIPDSVEVRHILRRVETQEQIAPAQALLDSLQTLLVNGTQSFDSLAFYFSQDGSKDRGGNLGMTGPGKMVAPFDNLIFNQAETGKVYQVATQFGLHLVELTKKKFTSDESTGLRIAFIDDPIIPSQETQDIAYEKVQDVITDHRTLESLQRYADEQGLDLESAGPLGPNAYSIPSLGSGQTSRDIVRWAFGKELEPGDVSPDIYIYENDQLYYNENLVIAGLKSIVPAGLARAADIRDEISTTVANRMKAEALRSGIGAQGLSALASAYGVSVDTVRDLTYNALFVENIGQEPAFVGAAAQTAQGSRSPVITGQAAAYVLVPLAKTEPAAVENLAFFRRSTTQGTKRSADIGIMNGMKEGASIEDQRGKYY